MMCGANQWLKKLRCTCVVGVLDAPHHLTGLYIWSKDKSGMKLKWIQAIIEIVRKQTEAGVKSIKTLLFSDLSGGNSILGLPEAAQILKPRFNTLNTRPCTTAV